MKRVLLVDDDPMVLRLYKDALARQGLEVDTALDGIAAMRALHNARADVVVLDLMMPRLAGLDFLRLLKAQPELSNIPVIVLSNAYMGSLADDAAEAKVEKALCKTRCSPSTLWKAIKEVLSKRVAAAHSSDPTPASSSGGHETRLYAKARNEFIDSAAVSCASIRKLFQVFSNAPPERRPFRLQDLYRQIHFLTASAGLAGCHRLAQVASALEALLFQMMDQPSRITPSVLRTTAMAIDLLQMLFQRSAQTAEEPPLLRAQVLVVDDDPVCTRLVLSALGQAQLRARTTGDPREALEWAAKSRYDLMLVDIGLPGMDGFEFCRQIRRLPGYAEVPIIHLTASGDFDTRAKSALSGGDDFITKPVLPMELALKVILHLIEKEPPVQTAVSE